MVLSFSLQTVAESRTLYNYIYTEHTKRLYNWDVLFMSELFDHITCNA